MALHQGLALVDTHIRCHAIKDFLDHRRCNAYCDYTPQCSMEKPASLGDQNKDLV